MKVRLDSIDLDVSIQCRATIDTGIVNEYAERMTEGDKFPPIVLFGNAKRSWIGDGWHRVMAARQVGVHQIDADLRPGGRIDALKPGLHANGVHGLRRTNADKHRCVEIALREFPKLSSRAIAEMCGVDHEMVDGLRPHPLAENANATRTTKDGRQYPAHREPTSPPQEPAAEEPEEAAPPQTEERTVGPPGTGLGGVEPGFETNPRRVFETACPRPTIRGGHGVTWGLDGR